MEQRTVKQRIALSISRRKGSVFFPRDFKRIGSSSQVGRALRALILEGRLVRVGHGIYVKARPSIISGKPIPGICLAEITQEALIKWGIPVRLGRAQAAYAEGRTNQVPYKTAFDTGKHRISRKITVGTSTVEFQNDFDTRD